MAEEDVVDVVSVSVDRVFGRFSLVCLCRGFMVALWLNSYGLQA